MNDSLIDGKKFKSSIDGIQLNSNEIDDARRLSVIPYILQLENKKHTRKYYNLQIHTQIKVLFQGRISY